MRAKRRYMLLPGLLAAALLATAPLTVGAAPGLPPAVAVTPDQPGPGAEVEVSGLDFPPEARIELLLITNAGVTPLGEAATSTTGAFRHVITLPQVQVPGWWEIRATGPGDAIAVRLFKPGAPVARPVAPPEGSVAEPAAAAAASGNAGPAEVGEPLPSTDLIVMAILGVLLGGIAVVTVVAWRSTRRRGPGPDPVGDPDLPAGDDPIWSGARGSR
jgi:hypothetical protein